MLGMVRERALTDGAYFFLVSLLNGKAFWESTALSMVDGLLRPSIGWPTQLTAFLRRLTPMLGLPTEVRDAIAGASDELTPEHLDAFIAALRRFNRPIGQETQDTARALVLHGSADMKAQDVGYAYLTSLDGGDTNRPRVLGPRRGLAVAAADRARHVAAARADRPDGDRDRPDRHAVRASRTSSVIRARRHRSITTADRLLGQVADGLMNLREVTRRTLTLVACLPDTWALIKRGSATPVPDRFRETFTLDRIPDANIGRDDHREAVRRALQRDPVPSALPDLADRRERRSSMRRSSLRARLIRRVERHIQDCLQTGEVVELERLDDRRGPTTTGVETDVLTTAPEDLAEMDAGSPKLRSAADVTAATDPKTEDQALPPLLAAGLAAWITESSDDGNSYKQDPAPECPSGPARAPAPDPRRDHRRRDALGLPGRSPATCAVAVISRVRAACTMAALDAGVPKQKARALTQ